MPDHPNNHEGLEIKSRHQDVGLPNTQLGENMKECRDVLAGEHVALKLDKPKYLMIMKDLNQGHPRTSLLMTTLTLPYGSRWLLLLHNFIDTYP